MNVDVKNQYTVKILPIYCREFDFFKQYLMIYCTGHIFIALGVISSAWKPCRQRHHILGKCLQFRLKQISITTLKRKKKRYHEAVLPTRFSIQILNFNSL